MKAREKDVKEFVLSWLKEHHTADYCNGEFQEAFWEKFGGKRILYMYGAMPVKKSARWLKNLYDQGILYRYRVGLTLMEPGFPKWVWVYCLPEWYNGE